MAPSLFKMPVCTEKTVFYHLPKAGGSYVERCIEQAVGFKSRHKKGQHDAPLDDAFKHYRKRYAFTCIRNPLHWLRSVFNWLEDNHEISERLGRVEILKLAYTPREGDPPYETDLTRFDEFVKRYLREIPGVVTNLYADYINCCEFVCRIESIQNDLIDVLGIAGEDFDPVDIWAFPVCNASESKKLMMHPWDAQTARLFVRSEYPIFRDYYPVVLDQCSIPAPKKEVADGANAK